MTRSLGTLEQYWRKAAAGIDKVFGQHAAGQPHSGQHEREMLVFTAETQSLTGKLERLRTDFERRSSQDREKFQALDQARDRTDRILTEHSGRLEELRCQADTLSEQLQRLRELATALEATLGDETKRLEARANQIKFLQDSGREQLQALKTQLAEASSRSQTRDNELAGQQDTVRGQLETLEVSLCDATGRIDATDGELTRLRSALDSHVEELGARLSSGVTQIDAAANRLEVLEAQRDTEDRLQRNILEDLQKRIQEQEKLLRRSRLIGAALLTVLALAGILLALG